MTIQIIQGNLFDPAHNFDALAQGVNTQGVMGAGIAVPFRDTFPDMYEEYKELCGKFGPALGGLVHTYRPDIEQISFSFTPSVVDQYDLDVDFVNPTIYNMFSQVMPGRNGDYRLLQQAAIQVLFDAEEMGFESVGLPWIGCGIAGLERHNVLRILEHAWEDSEVEFVIVQQDPIHEEVSE